LNDIISNKSIQRTVWSAPDELSRCFVRDSQGDVFEMYLDYANRKKPTWWLAEKWAEKRSNAVES
ncbi:MAG: hypothetical protein ABIL62_14660, partial [Planctomycetota bacterium]